MNFPNWVCRSAAGGRASQATIASNRLKYILKKIAIEHNQRGSTEQLARAIGMHHSTFSIYIRRGHFSNSAAAAIEKMFGREIVKADWLCEPLNIESASEK